MVHQAKDNGDSGAATDVVVAAKEVPEGQLLGGYTAFDLWRIGFYLLMAYNWFQQRGPWAPSESHHFRCVACIHIIISRLLPHKSHITYIIATFGLEYSALQHDI